MEIQKMNNKDQLALFESIINYSKDAIVSKTLDGVITIWNKNAEILFGYTDKEIEGENISLIIPSECADEEAEIRLQIRQGKYPARYETMRICKDGSKINISLAPSPIKNEDGIIVGTAEIIQDITASKRLETDMATHIEILEKELQERTKQLEQANREMESFSYSISHDLRAPLRIINGYSDILEKDYLGKLDEEGVRILKVITNNTQRMGVLIDELLKLAKAGSKEMIIQTTNMDELVNDVIREQIAVTGKPAGIKKNKLIAASCDVLMIRQVWSNLISNAIKYSGKKTDQCIEINSFIHDDKVVYSVKDNGAGFDMLYSNKLFGVFQRLHSQSEFSGTGASLALVQRIIAKHNGEVWAEAEVDKGATFYFSLPAIN